MAGFDWRMGARVGQCGFERRSDGDDGRYIVRIGWLQCDCLEYWIDCVVLGICDTKAGVEDCRGWKWKWKCKARPLNQLTSR